MKSDMSFAPADYGILAAQLSLFADEDPDLLPLFSNASALVWEALEGINWSGFYVVKNGRLVLGPFQGKPACIHIEKGKGVCGTAWEQDSTQLVPDVHEFPGHIACDSASNSEIVVPIHGRDGQVAAVLDIDSPHFSRFGEEDRAGLEAFVRVLEERTDWN